MKISHHLHENTAPPSWKYRTSFMKISHHLHENTAPPSWKYRTTFMKISYHLHENTAPPSWKYRTSFMKISHLLHENIAPPQIRSPSSIIVSGRTWKVQILPTLNLLDISSVLLLGYVCNCWLVNSCAAVHQSIIWFHLICIFRFYSFIKLMSYNLIDFCINLHVSLWVFMQLHYSKFFTLVCLWGL
jgi:hypothetical protein